VESPQALLDTVQLLISKPVTSEAFRIQ